MMDVLELSAKYGNALEVVRGMAGEGTVTVIPRGLLYLSHPFGGLKDNMFDAGLVANRLQAKFGTTRTILSPIHNFSWLSYREEKSGYWEDIFHCLRLLSSCDGMVLTGDWKKSLGCCIEYLYALDHHIPVYIAEGL